LFVCLLLATAPVWAADPVNDHIVIKADDIDHNRSDRHHHFTTNWQHTRFDDGVILDIDDGSVFLTHEDYRHDEIEITEDYELIVNGEEVALTESQQELVIEYHDLTYAIIDEALDIGWEGAKLGAEGAKVGLYALANLVKLVRSDYDSDDYERDVERKAAQVERKAAKLEKRASEIEEMADDLEDTLDEMFEDIPALRDLEWN
jgi:hypothetical protein